MGRNVGLARIGEEPPEEVIGTVAMAGFSRLPVHEGDLDHIIGFVYTKDLLRQQAQGGATVFLSTHSLDIAQELAYLGFKVDQDFDVRPSRTTLFPSALSQ